ncbi:twin-arginine translocation signal domain-containing protein [Haloarcula sp. H-GB4]|uniref:twin-arginine translocation signal domain-containing protein n=1 Tax=Haloarcula sp. H-GB4 TaxID=3069755 RepID=UPI0027AF8E03|nr:twin-arginine translocation signal domain-containing protein [Haloarcula sp. H-GB4]MDQ2074545.1 twin-arginine translocation signal domain-containing protein [Haloarcula sp. H-GB4]
MKLSRRDFLTAAGAGTVGALAEGAWGATQSTEPITSVDNPLKSYPNRDWEQVYHDIYAYDEVDWTVCHPNCTQSCALNFYMKTASRYGPSRSAPSSVRSLPASHSIS